MAPENEQIIREKILEAEGGPVVWNKDRVWQNISFEQKKGTGIYWVSGIAAAVLLVIVSGVYMFSSRYNHSLYNRIAVLESKLSEYPETAVRNAVTINPVECNPAADRAPSNKEHRIANKARSQRRTDKSEVGSSPLTEGFTKSEKDVVAYRTPIPAETLQQVDRNSGIELLTSNHPDTDATQVSKAQVVSAIVGKIPEPVISVPKRSKKLKIQVLPGPEDHPVAAAAEHSQSFIARLN